MGLSLEAVKFNLYSLHNRAVFKLFLHVYILIGWKNAKNSHYHDYKYKI